MPAGTRLQETGGRRRGICGNTLGIRYQVHFEGEGNGIRSSWEAGCGSEAMSRWPGWVSVLWCHSDSSAVGTEGMGGRPRHLPLSTAPQVTSSLLVCRLVCLWHPQGGWDSKSGTLTAGHGHVGTRVVGAICSSVSWPGLETEPSPGPSPHWTLQPSSRGSRAVWGG